MSAVSSTKVKKTRNRVPMSCDHCRRRKLKCDRLSPCGNCLRSRCEENCKYVSNPKSPSAHPKVQLNGEVIRLKMKINQLEKLLKANGIDISEYSDMLTNGFTNVNAGSANKDDPVMSMTEKFESLVVKENRLMYSGTTAYINFINSDTQLSEIFGPYIKKHASIYESFTSLQEVRAVDVMNEPHAFEPEWLALRSASAINVCDITSDKIQSPTKVNLLESAAMTEIIANINKIMPPLFVVHTLVDNFFNFVYPVFPYINEAIFKEELSVVLIPTKDGGCRVELTHFQNASIISLLLIVLRFSYLSLKPRTSRESPIQIDNDILAALINSGSKIEHTFVLYSKTLLMSLPSNDTIFRKVRLRNIQVLLYLRLYQMYSPELNDESSEHSITLALLIQMSHVLGANMDPTKFPNVYQDERVITVWRRIYYKLLSLDVLSSYNYATPLIINEREWSMKLPSLSDRDIHVLETFKNNKNVDIPINQVNKLAIENAINTDIALDYEFYKLAKEGLSVFQNFTDSNKKSQYLAVVKKMEDFLRDKIPSFFEIVKDEGATMDIMFDLQKVKVLEIRLALSTFLQTFYYLLYLFEVESDSEDVYTFALKATETAMVIFKVAYGYAEYMNQLGTGDDFPQPFQCWTKFSHNLQSYIFNITQAAYQRSSLWISSMFMRNLVENRITIENLIKDFSNSLDSSMVLSWLNVDIQSSQSLMLTNKELMVIIFNYTKKMFMLLQQLKGEYFVAWRTSTLIQMFLNKFKNEDETSCKTFMSCDIGRAIEDDRVYSFPDSISAPYPATTHDSVSDNISPFTNESSGTSKTPNSGVDLVDLQMYDDKVKGLFYDNVDSLIDDIFTAGEERASLFKRFDLFDTRDFNSNDPLEGFMNEFGPTQSKVPSLISKASTSSGITSGSSNRFSQPSLETGIGFSMMTPGKNTGSSNDPVASPGAANIINSFDLNTPSDGDQMLKDFGIQSQSPEKLSELSL